MIVLSPLCHSHLLLVYSSSKHTVDFEMGKFQLTRDKVHRQIRGFASSKIAHPTLPPPSTSFHHENEGKTWKIPEILGNSVFICAPSRKKTIRGAYCVTFFRPKKEMFSLFFQCARNGSREIERLSTYHRNSSVQYPVVKAEGYR